MEKLEKREKKTPSAFFIMQYSRNVAPPRREKCEILDAMKETATTKLADSYCQPGAMLQ